MFGQTHICKINPSLEWCVRAFLGVDNRMSGDQTWQV